LQELLEGFAALFAVAMLIWVSNWMINKSSNKAWDEYIKKQTDASLSSGSLLGLAFISFLAVLREGAETILFYVPIVAAAGDKVHYVWIGLAVGLVALVIIYLLIQFAAVRIPLRPFFTITSLLMAFMAFTFTGSGIGELQEADVVSLTPISGFPTIDLLGIYPRVENLAAQAIVLAIIVGGLFVAVALSDVIQISVFKATGKRVFRMAPLHHHFELMGWKEVTIVIRFWLIAAISAVTGAGIFYAEWVSA